MSLREQSVRLVAARGRVTRIGKRRQAGFAELGKDGRSGEKGRNLSPPDRRAAAAERTGAGASSSGSAGPTIEPEAVVGLPGRVGCAVGGRLRRDGHDDRLDLARHDVEDDARLRVGPEERAGVGHERPAGPVLLADVGVPVEDVVEEVGVLQLPQLVPLVAVDPGQPLTGEFQRPERVVMRPADFLDRGAPVSTGPCPSFRRRSASGRA